MKGCNDFPEGDMPGVEADVETPEPKIKWLPGGFLSRPGADPVSLLQVSTISLQSYNSFLRRKIHLFTVTCSQLDRIRMLSE